MFDAVEAWLSGAREAARRYAALRRRIEELETEAAVALADMVEAYAWPEGLPVPERLDGYGVQKIEGRAFGEDLTCELAVAGGMSEGAASLLVMDVLELRSRLPRCWARVAEGARRTSRQSGRFVRTGGDDVDPLTGWLSARLDRADAIFLDATVQLVADTLATRGDGGTRDERRARALGLLANPAAAVGLIGVHTTRGLDPVPESQADRDAIMAQAAALAPALTPRVQVYVHYWAESDFEAEALARVESVGGLLAEQVAALTQGCSVRVTPAIHVGDAGVAVDAYEIPQRIRDRVLLRDGHDVFPWSSAESRRLDLDHTVPWLPDGPPGQTAPGNLGPLSRRAHRVKAHAGWRLDQPSPGDFVWCTGAGQVIRVDQFGTHPVRDRE